MNAMKPAIVAAAVLLACAAAWSQDLADPVLPDSTAPANAPTTRPAQPVGTPGLPQPRELSADEIDRMLQSMSPEQIEELVKSAVASQLKTERQLVAAEIRDNLAYWDRQKEIEAAIKRVNDKPKDTQKDNIQRILEALAIVDPVFAKPYKLFTEGKFEPAAEAAKELLDAQRTTYLSAAQHYLYAEALAAAGKLEDAVEVYSDLMVNMPDRMSFAASASLSAAKAYEKLHRFQYAMEMYVYCIKNYALTLDKEQGESITKKIDDYIAIYKDPLAHLAGEMGQVQGRLAKSDSGKKTQETEQQIIALLDDLIKTAEDRQGGGGGQSKKRQRGEREGEQEGEGQGQGQGQQQAQGSQGGDQPTSPMQDSRLVPGAVQRPNKLSQTHNSGESGDWSTLPPRQREQIMQSVKKVLTERHKGIIRDYHSRLSKEGVR